MTLEEIEQLWRDFHSSALVPAKLEEILTFIMWITLI